MLSLIYGSAFEVPADDTVLDHPNVRPYRVGDRAFIGHDTDDIAHVCGPACIPIFDGYSVTDDGASYVSLEPVKYTDGRSTDRFPTIDVVSFDPGDDPYVLCETCGAELLRDDDAYLAQYGRPIS